MSDRKLIRVNADTFRELKEHKGRNTWDAYLLDLKDGAQGGPTVGVNDESIEDIADAVAGRLSTDD